MKNLGGGYTFFGPITFLLTIFVEILERGSTFIPPHSLSGQPEGVIMDGII
jgi:hypothetical protein